MGQPLRQLILASMPLELDSSGAPPTRFRLAAFGKNSTSKGVFELRREDAARMVEEAKRRGLKLSADYEHAAVHAAMKGTKAPAACWFDLELGDDGLYAANVEWTEDATTHLKKREYRYWSPWFGQREDGSVGTFKNFALTNRPAMDALTPLVASEDAEFTDATPEKPKMKTLFKHLALADDASEAEVLEKVQGLSQERDAFFTATGTKDLPAALAAVETFKRDASRAKELQVENDALKGAQAAKERELLLSEGVRTKRIPPNMKDFWASQPVGTLQEYLKHAPAVDAAAGGGETPKQKDPAEVELALTAEDKEAAKLIGIPEEKFAAHKKQMLQSGQV